LKTNEFPVIVVTRIFEDIEGISTSMTMELQED